MTTGGALPEYNRAVDSLERVRSDPERFFVPPYVGHRGWIGLRLDVDPDWEEVAGVITDAYRNVAPEKLAARLD